MLTKRPSINVFLSDWKLAVVQLVVRNPTDHCVQFLLVRVTAKNDLTKYKELEIALRNVSLLEAGSQLLLLNASFEGSTEIPDVTLWNQVTRNRNSRSVTCIPQK